MNNQYNLFLKYLIYARQWVYGFIYMISFLFYYSHFTEVCLIHLLMMLLTLQCVAVNL